jgi:hypothetical protein
MPLLEEHFLEPSTSGDDLSDGDIAVIREFQVISDDEEDSGANGANAEMNDANEVDARDAGDANNLVNRNSA